MNDLLNESNHRPCSHRPPCPGCPHFGAEGLPPNAKKLIERWSCQVETFEVHRGERFDWRHRARLAVRGRANSPKIGIFQSGSHRIADIPSCPNHHPLINESARALKAAIRSTQVAPYRDSSHKGDLRYAQFVIERSTQRVQITLVTRQNNLELVESLADALSKALGPKLHSICWNHQPHQTNAVFGPETHLITGEPTVVESLPHARVFFPADAFGQANPAAAENLIEKIRSHVPCGAKVIDLYSGVGPIGLSLMDLAQSLTFVEIGQGSLTGLRMGINALPPTDQARVKVREGTVIEHVDALIDRDVVIADPPRKGLDAELISALCQSPHAKTILVHCGLDAFERDLERLVNVGPFCIADMSAHDFFPHSDHVEMLTVLRPSKEI